MSESEKSSSICSISAINSSFRGHSTLKPTPSLEVTVHENDFYFSPSARNL